LLLQPSVSGVAVSMLVSRLTVDILNTFCGVFVVQYVNPRVIDLRVVPTYVPPGVRSRGFVAAMFCPSGCGAVVHSHSLTQ